MSRYRSTCRSTHALRPCGHPVGARALLRDQRGPLAEPPLQLQRPRVRGRPVPLRRDDQRRRQPRRPRRPRPYLGRTLPDGHRPGGAGQVQEGVGPGLEGRAAGQFGVVAVPGLPVGGPRGVVAQHRRVDGRRVLGLRRPLRIARRLPGQRARVPAQKPRQRRGPLRPHVVVVRRLQVRRVQLARPHDAARRGPGHRRADPLVTRTHRRGGGAETVRRVVAGRPGKEVGPAALETRGLAEVVEVPDAARIRIDGRVEDHAAHVARVAGRVDRPQIGAVRGPHEAQPPLAERGAQHVQVADVVQGRVLGQGGPGTACAAPRVRPGGGQPLLLVRGEGTAGTWVGPCGRSPGSWQDSGAERPTPRGA